MGEGVEDDPNLESPPEPHRRASHTRARGRKGLAGRQWASGLPVRQTPAQLRAKADRLISSQMPTARDTAENRDFSASQCRSSNLVSRWSVSRRRLQA